ncbi:MAG: Chromatin assembly factor 1, subunit A [Paramarteilia canceri]
MINPESEIKDKVISTINIKLFIFHENYRPGYLGSCLSKPFSRCKPRNPFFKAENLLDYDYDSDDEWDNQVGESGESLGCSEDEVDSLDGWNNIDDEFDDLIAPDSQNDKENKFPTDASAKSKKTMDDLYTFQLPISKNYKMQIFDNFDGMNESLEIQKRSMDVLVSVIPIKVSTSILSEISSNKSLCKESENEASDDIKSLSNQFNQNFISKIEENSSQSQHYTQDWVENKIPKMAFMSKLTECWLVKPELIIKHTTNEETKKQFAEIKKFYRKKDKDLSKSQIKFNSESKKILIWLLHDTNESLNRIVQNFQLFWTRLCIMKYGPLESITEHLFSKEQIEYNIKSIAFKQSKCNWEIVGDIKAD